MTGSQDEFWAGFIIYGTVITLGLLFSGLLGLAVYIQWKKNKKGNVIKKLYEQERKNGKGGARGSY